MSGTSPPPNASASPSAVPVVQFPFGTLGAPSPGGVLSSAPVDSSWSLLGSGEPTPESMKAAAVAAAGVGGSPPLVQKKPSPAQAQAQALLAKVQQQQQQQQQISPPQLQAQGQRQQQPLPNGTAAKPQPIIATSSSPGSIEAVVS